jgi:hypothetical protein
MRYRTGTLSKQNNGLWKKMSCPSPRPWFPIFQRSTIAGNLFSTFLQSVLRIRIRCFFNPLDPGSGSRMRFFPDPGSFWLWLRLRLCSWNHTKQEQHKFATHFSCRIRDEKMFGPGMRNVQILIFKITISISYAKSRAKGLTKCV